MANLFQEFIPQSSFPAYDRVSKKGFWKLLVVRTTRNDQCLNFLYYIFNSL